MKKAAISLLLFFLALASFAQLLNGNMENYSILPYDTVPEHWSVSSSYATVIGRTSDAHSGSSAFVINTWYYYGPGFMVNGNLESYNHLYQWIKGGTPISGKPAAVKGFYKYTEALAHDSALVQVILKKWNTVKNKPDTLAYGRVALAPVNVYTPFELSIQDFSTAVQPDSMVIRFVSHDLKNLGLPPTGNCRYLYIDDVSLSYSTTTTGMKEQAQQAPVSFYVNQQTLNILNPETKHFTLELWSLDGRLLSTKEVTAPEDQMDLLSFSKGIYLLRTQGDVFVKQKIFRE